MGAVRYPMLMEAILAADEAGIKIEMMDGVSVWEALPTIRHQTSVDRIRAGIRRAGSGGSDCGCYHYSDIAIRFEGGSFKRPDIAVYRVAPKDVDEATEEIPVAVIEIISKGYEAKDLQFGLPFYLRRGVADVVIYDPSTLVVIHATASGALQLVAPCELTFACGCLCQIPI